MGVIEETFEELEVDIDLEEFHRRVQAKVSEMGGLADDATAAMLVAHEIEGDRPIDIEALTPEMELVTILGVVRRIGEVRTFERDDGETGAVVNLEIADATGTVRAAFWDQQASAAVDEIDRGDTLRLKARPRAGRNGIEVSVTDVRIENDLEVDIAKPEPHDIASLEPGMEGVIIEAETLRVGDVRTFSREDDEDGRVATVILGDETGAVPVSLWDDATAAVDDLEPERSTRIEGGYTRERDGRLELHVGSHSLVEPCDTEVSYRPAATPIETVSEDDTVTLSGIVRSTDPVRTFDRDDGSEGKVRNVRVQDETGSIRLALWGERAEVELAPGDAITAVDVLIKDGYQDDLEASANWRSTILTGTRREAAETPTRNDAAPEQPPADETTTFTGTVVQPGEPIIIDDGTETVRVDYDGEVTLGERVTVAGTRSGDHIDADRLEPASNPQ